jgi:hypothetical protein
MLGRTGRNVNHHTELNPRLSLLRPLGFGLHDRKILSPRRPVVRRAGPNSDSFARGRVSGAVGECGERSHQQSRQMRDHGGWFASHIRRPADHRGARHGPTCPIAVSSVWRRSKRRIEREAQCLDTADIVIALGKPLTRLPRKTYRFPEFSSTRRNRDLSSTINRSTGLEMFAGPRGHTRCGKIVTVRWEQHCGSVRIGSTRHFRYLSSHSTVLRIESIWFSRLLKP